MVVIGMCISMYIVYYSSQNWRAAARFVLFAVVFEGLLRKWILPQASELIYFLKDMIFVGAYIGFLAHKKEVIFKTAQITRLEYFLKSLLFLLLIWMGFQALNPRLGSPLLGLFGMKFYLLFIPLMWMMPYLFKSKEELERFLRNYLLLAIPICLLGLIQFFSPLNSPINTYTDSPVGTELVGTFHGSGRIRVTSTFSYIGGMATFLSFCFGIFLGLLGSNTSSNKIWTLFGSIELLLLLLGTFMNGSRSVMVTMLILMAGFFVLQGFKGAERFSRRLAPLIFLGVLVFSFAFGFSNNIKEPIESFAARTTENSDLGSRIINQVLQPIDLFQLTGMDGYGVGSTHQGVTAFQIKLGLPASVALPNYHAEDHTKRIEAEPGKVFMELGPIGFLLWYGFRVTILLSLWRTYSRLEDTILKQLALSAVLQHIALLSSFIYLNHVAQVYYWFLSGFIFLLPHLEGKERAKHLASILSHESSFQTTSK